MATSTIQKNDKNTAVSMFTAASGLEWYWQTPVERKYGDMRFLCTGVKLSSAGSGYVTIGQIASGHRPPVEFRFVAVSQESGEARFGRVGNDGVMVIYNPKAETYWFEAIWAV